MTDTTEPLPYPYAVDAAFADPRVVRVRHYEAGWVPNAYRWPAPGTGTEYWLDADGALHAARFGYDRKRPYGKAPRVVGYSAKGGRLYSC